MLCRRILLKFNLSTVMYVAIITIFQLAETQLSAFWWFKSFPTFSHKPHGLACPYRYLMKYQHQIVNWASMLYQENEGWLKWGAQIPSRLPFCWSGSLRKRTMIIEWVWNRKPSILATSCHIDVMMGHCPRFLFYHYNHVHLHMHSVHYIYIF